MNREQKKKISKWMSLVLRHEPDSIGIQLDSAGWVAVDQLLLGMNRSGKKISREQIQTVVRDNDKQRFEFSEDGIRIRATQGHSVVVELDHPAAVPPDVLFHGTPGKYVESIRKQGLMKQQRHHVHLHTDASLASEVGSRRGRPCLLEINAKQMSADGIVFYVTPNDVWLTDHVPPNYICFPP